jgi:adenylate kinase family enzyme
LKVIYIDCNLDKLTQRIKFRKKIEKREDDDFSVFKNRVKIFENEKETLISIFNENLVKINGDDTIENIKEDIFNIIKNGKGNRS